MRCGRCPEGRRFAKGSTFCLMYGMIISDEHEGKLKGCEGDEDNSRDSQGRTGLQQDGGNAAGSLQGVLQQTGERASIFGLEEDWPE